MKKQKEHTKKIQDKATSALNTDIAISTERLIDSEFSRKQARTILDTIFRIVRHLSDGTTKYAKPPDLLESLPQEVPELLAQSKRAMEKNSSTSEKAFDLMDQLIAETQKTGEQTKES